MWLWFYFACWVLKNNNPSFNAPLLIVVWLCHVLHCQGKSLQSNSWENPEEYMASIEILSTFPMYKRILQEIINKDHMHGHMTYGFTLVINRNKKLSVCLATTLLPETFDKEDLILLLPLLALYSGIYPITKCYSIICSGM